MGGAGEAPGTGPGAGPGTARPPLSGTRAERYQVLLHVGPDTLRAAGEGPSTKGPEAGRIEAGRVPERSHLEDGTRLAAETSRRLCCDASVVRVTRGDDGSGSRRSVLGVGRKRRTIPPALRRALEVRDRGCRFPTTRLRRAVPGGLRFTDAHHMVHWADGGKTDLDNLVLLCRFHHRRVHEGGWRVEFWDPDRHAAFIDPRGRVHLDPDAAASRLPAHRLPERPVEALVEAHEGRSIEPDGWSLTPRHARAADVPWQLHARALDALDTARFGVGEDAPPD